LNPATCREVVKRMHQDIARSVMVGDNETDVLAARAAGVPVIAVSFGCTPRPVADFSPDFVISLRRGIASDRQGARFLTSQEAASYIRLTPRGGD
jgi:phosphoglycolate phosphatase-like HAD superfamily hydrolase